MFLKKCDNRLVHHCMHGLAINAFRVFANLFKFLAKRLRAGRQKYKVTGTFRDMPFRRLRQSRLNRLGMCHGDARAAQLGRPKLHWNANFFKASFVKQV